MEIMLSLVLDGAPYAARYKTTDETPEMIAYLLGQGIKQTVLGHIEGVTALAKYFAEESNGSQ